MIIWGQWPQPTDDILPHSNGIKSCPNNFQSREQIVCGPFPKLVTLINNLFLIKCVISIRLKLYHSMKDFVNNSGLQKMLISKLTEWGFPSKIANISHYFEQFPSSRIKKNQATKFQGSKHTGAKGNKPLIFTKTAVSKYWSREQTTK